MGGTRGLAALASVQAGEKTNSFEETILVREKNQISSAGECFQASDSRTRVFRHGLQDDYISSKPHVEGELFP